MPSSQKKYLVTGGTGFIGSALVRRLVAQGRTVRVLDNNLRGATSRLADVMTKLEFIEGDIRDRHVVDKAVEGVDIVCHLAYLNGTEYFYSKPELVLDIGVKGMTNVLDSCLKFNVRQLILASSSEVYQSPPQVPTDESAPLIIPDLMNPRYSYGGGKIISELLTIHYGRKYFDRAVIFRPHNVYGPDMGYEHVIPQFAMRMKALLEAQGEDPLTFPIQGTGKETRSFIYIDDFIDGVMLVINQGEHLNVYHIGTMDELAIDEVAREVGRCFGKDLVVVPGMLQSGGTKRRCPDIGKLRKLGFDPRVSLREGIQKTVRWYATYGEIKKMGETK